MMKVASLMLILALASTCMIGTTFAKYVTEDQASDTARVAKWGITVATSGTLFGNLYAANSVGTPAANQIAASSTNVASTVDVVAPGTKNTTGLKVAITGQPEVAYNVTLSANASNEDIYLVEGEYAVMVEVFGLNDASDVVGLYTKDASNTYTVVPSGSAWDKDTTYYARHDLATVGAGGYYPIQWTVTDNSVSPAVSTNYRNAADVIAKLDDMNGTRNANVAATDNLTVTWDWAFDTADNAYSNSAADTILGNLMAATVGVTNIVKLNGTSGVYEAITVTAEKTATVGTTPTTIANLEVFFGFGVIVEQVN